MTVSVALSAGTSPPITCQLLGAQQSQAQRSHVSLPHRPLVLLIPVPLLSELTRPLPSAHAKLSILRALLSNPPPLLPGNFHLLNSYSAPTREVPLACTH